MDQGNDGDAKHAGCEDADHYYVHYFDDGHPSEEVNCLACGASSLGGCEAPVFEENHSKGHEYDYHSNDPDQGGDSRRNLQTVFMSHYWHLSINIKTNMKMDNYLV